MVKCYKKNYYRPQFVREQWEDLCGEWDFIFDDLKVGESKEYYKNFPTNSLKINVPYTYETIASNINDENIHESIWYRKKIYIGKLNKNRYLINFEGVDYLCKVWVNGNLVCVHEGGCCRFSIDATNNIIEERENEIVVLCEDSLDTTQPRGKQRWLKNSYGCWYIQTTGIYKPVWSELVSLNRLERVKITPCFDEENVTFEYEFLNFNNNIEIETEISFENVIINKTRSSVVRKNFLQTVDLRCDEFDFKVKIWNHDFPNLYDVTFKVFENNVLIDQVKSYFGLRKITADETGIKINNNPIYQKLILAQNYWKETGLTIPNEEAILNDLNYVKKAGFNGVRIHQKIEDERFLFYCDVMGILVWSEFPATYEYNDLMIKRLSNEWINVVMQMYNHPSIITWVPFNESWGIPNIFNDKKQQNFTIGVYNLTKAIDLTRPIITNDGWEHTISDIITLHDYDGNGSKMEDKYSNRMNEILENKVAHGGYKFAFAKDYNYNKQPIIVSEYGGIALNNSDGWGYNGKVKDEEELLLKYQELTMAIKNNNQICGYCYTQLTDTYQEVNGLLDANHNPKIDINKIKEINDL